MKVVLTIAGSDSGGGAGIQADLKTFEAHGLFGTTAITSLTAQNTVSVRDIFPIPPAFIRSQIEAIFDDFDVAAIKTGMLLNAECIEAVADVLRERGAGIPLVVDPVMVATSGDRLLLEDAVDALKTRLLPLSRLVTPNLAEAEILSGFSILTQADIARALKAIHKLSSDAVLIKGGHRPDRIGEEEVAAGAVDHLLNPRFGAIPVLYPGEWIETEQTHGTGCTLSAAIAANLALGLFLGDAVWAAKRFVREAMLHAPGLGKGNGPLLHSWRTPPEDPIDL